MSVSGGPNVTNKGLVLAFDVANPRSFRGEPTTNEADTDFKRTIQFHSQVAYNNAGTIVSASEYGPDWKRIVISDRGTNFRIAQFPYINHPADVTKTYSLEYDSQRLSGYYIRVDGYGAPSATINLTGAGKLQITILSGSGIGGNCALFLNNNVTGSLAASESIYFRNYQVEQKSYATPFTPTTRGSSSADGGGLINLTYNGNDGILVSNSRYETSNIGILSFEGTSSYVSVPNFTSSIQSSSAFTMGLFFNMTTLDTLRGLIGTLNYVCGRNIGIVANSTALAFYNDTGTCYSVDLINWVETNKWLYAVATYDGVTSSIYGIKDGVLTKNTGTTKSGSANVYTSDFRIMGNQYAPYFTAGKTSGAYVYNRALTQDEILQNFNAQRSRFGV